MRRSTAIRRRFTLRSFYRSEIRGKRVLLADDVRNTGDTFARCAALVAEAGGTVMATAAIYDRLEAVIDLGVPNIALAGYKAPPNYKVGSCPLCDSGIPLRILGSCRTVALSLRVATIRFRLCRLKVFVQA